MGLAYAPGLVSEPAAEVESEDERSANLLRHAATMLFGKPVFGRADPIRVTSAPTPVPDRIGLADVGQVATATARLSQLANDLGGISMAEALTEHARAVEALLGVKMQEPIRQQLLIALAEAHRAAGMAAGDAALRDRARQHFARAMSCAGAADDKVRVVINLRSEGATELRFGLPNEALKLFQLGAGGAPTELTRAMLEYDCAHAFALLGLDRESAAALHRARAAHQRAAREPRSWERLGTALPHAEGCTQLVLGRFDLAVSALTAAVQGADHAVRCSTLNLSELATAQLRCGELRAGLQTAAQVVAKARTLRSVWVRERLAPLQQVAAARKDSACRDLAQELAVLRNAA